MTPGDIISYLELCQAEKCNLQRGMNFKLRPTHSVILMSVRPGAPYQDEVVDEGRTLIYEGHDINNFKNGPNPKDIDQPRLTLNGSLTQNGLFDQAAQLYAQGRAAAEPVKVYEKIKAGIWVYNGVFLLIDSSYMKSGRRNVFRFKLQLCEDIVEKKIIDLSHDRIIPSHVKLEVWRRDEGKCITCGSSENLHFDHIIPYSKGGSSKTAENIQLLCAKHNLSKQARLQ